jgi:DNA adenine methylase
MKSPLNYLGGKSRLADRIVRLIPKDHTCYCEPFCGASWVFFRKEPSHTEVINDRDSELVTFWRVIQNHLQAFLEHYRFCVISREIFQLEQKRDPSTMTDIQRAVRYYYLQKMSFGGKTHKRTFGTAPSGGPGLNILTMEDHLMDVHWRLARVVIEHLDACDCVLKYDRPQTFFYLDPPYYGTAGYRTAFGPDDYHRLSSTLKQIKGRFLLSLNDCREVRLIFKDFRIRRIQTKYSVANGRGCHDRDRTRTEVLISGGV